MNLSSECYRTESSDEESRRNYTKNDEELKSSKNTEPSSNKMENQKCKHISQLYSH